MTSLAIALALDALLAASLVAIVAVVWRRPGGVGIAPTLAAVLALVAALALASSLIGRARTLDQWPVANRFEFGLWFALAVLVVYAILLAARYPPGLGAPLLPLAAVVLASAILLVGPAERELQPVPPVLRSIWFPLHGLAAALGYGAGASAGALGVSLWLRSRLSSTGSMVVPENAAACGNGAGALEAADLAAAMGVCVEIAFVALSVAILTGMVWAQEAWGEYWSWYPKETWALVTWLLYLAFLHARRLADWHRRLPWLAVLGMIAIAFTLYGVPWLVRFTAVAEPHGF